LPVLTSTTVIASVRSMTSDPRGQPHLAVHRLGDLLVDAVLVKTSSLGRPALRPLRQVGGDVLDVVADLGPGVVALDDELGEVLGEDVADDPHVRSGSPCSSVGAPPLPAFLPADSAWP
jgi:hypothetical protein